MTCPYSYTASTTAVCSKSQHVVTFEAEEVLECCLNMKPVLLGKSVGLVEHVMYCTCVTCFTCGVW